jgi:hypothetical protein
MTDEAPAPALDPKVLDALKAMAETPQPKFILRNQSFFNQFGLRIDESLLVDGEFPEGFPRFVAHAVARIKLPLPQGKVLAPGEEGPVHKQPIQVPIPAATIQEAYTNAPKLLQEAADGYQKAFEESLTDKAAQAQISKNLGKGRKR